jgi:hypothetical protein
VIQFPAYRSFETSRIATNDAAMALLVSTQLAAYTLDQVPDSARDNHIPDIFSDLGHIGRLNRTVDDARAIVLDAERQLAYMAIPFVLSVYEMYVLDVIGLLREARIDISTADVTKLGLAKIHGYLSDLGLVLPQTGTALFDFIRLVRNRIVHYAGKEGAGLRTAYNAMSDDAKSLWRYLTGSEPPLGSPEEPLRLEAVHLFPALAVTNRLGEAINLAIGKVLPTEVWADVVVRDYFEQQPAGLDRARRIRKLTGLARFAYSEAGLGREVLEAALDRYTAEGK